MSRAVRGSIGGEGVVRTPSPSGAERGIAPPGKLQLLSENCSGGTTSSSSCTGTVSPAVAAFSSSSDAGGHGESSGGVVSGGDNCVSGGGISSAVSLLSPSMVANLSSSSSGRRTSRVWCYFTMIDNYHYACTLCQFIGTYTNTTNMRKHIQHHHPERYQDILDHTRPTARPNSLQYYMLDQHQQSMAQDVTVLNDMSSHYRPVAVSERGLSSAGAVGYGGYMPNQHHQHLALNSSVTFEPVAAKSSSDHKHSMEAQFNRYQHTLSNSSTVQNVSSVLHNHNHHPQQQSSSGQHHLYGTTRPNDSLGGSHHGKKLDYAIMPRSNIPPSSLDIRDQPPEYARHGSYGNSELRFRCDPDKQFGHRSSSKLCSNNNNNGNSEGEEMAGLRELKIEPDDSADSGTAQRSVSESESDIMNANQDGLSAGGGQRAMMQDDESGSGGGSAGLCGIEAVVAAAAAAAAAADESNSTVNNNTGGGMVVSSGGTTPALPVGGGGGMAGACQRPPVIGMSPPSAPVTPNKPESYQLRHNNHLSLVLNQLAEDEAFMDVTLTAEGRQVKAHKSVLSAVSPYFSSVLRANPCQHPIIIMPRDIRFSELSSIIMYIYKGEMTVSAEDLPSLLKTAELLRITGLSPGENANPQQHFSRYSSSGSGSNAFLSSGFNTMTTVNNQNTGGISVSSSNNGVNNNVAMSFRGSNSSRHQQSSPQQQRPQEQQISSRVEKMSKPPTTEIESPPPPEHTMLNPSDFMDLDMTCVKEELNSDNEEEDTETSSREVTTPPPMGNPLSPDKDKTSTSPQPALDLDADNTRPTRSPSLKADSASQNTNQEADDMKLNSLKTLANLASLDTPTNLSPSDSSSPASSCYDPSPNVCPYCSEYVTGEQIKAHLSSKHMYKPAHVCNICFRVYTKKNHFEMHSKECSKES